jgi:hypothetical protein
MIHTGRRGQARKNPAPRWIDSNPTVTDVSNELAETKKIEG